MHTAASAHYALQQFIRYNEGARATGTRHSSITSAQAPYKLLIISLSLSTFLCDILVKLTFDLTLTNYNVFKYFYYYKILQFNYKKSLLRFTMLFI